MSVLIFKTTSLLSDLNGGKVAIADYLPAPPPPPPPPPQKKKQTNKTNKQTKNLHICVIYIGNFN